MKVKHLIKKLQKQDPEKEVMIQQGEEFAYALAQRVKKLEVVEFEDLDTPTATAMM